MLFKRWVNQSKRQKGEKCKGTKGKSANKGTKGEQKLSNKDISASKKRKGKQKERNKKHCEYN
jgi:hypothetical protein